MGVSLPLFSPPVVVLLIVVAFYGLLPSFLTATEKRQGATGIHESFVRKDSGLENSYIKYGRSTSIFLPNILAHAKWPWPRQLNPNYVVVKKEADAWMASLCAFSPKAQDAFDRCEFHLLACLAYPKASKEHVRAGCELMDLVFMFDEHSDRSTPPEVCQQKDMIMDAIRNPHLPRPKGEWVGGELARQFWARTIQNATATSQRRFIQRMDEYLEGVAQESIDKKEHRILGVENYINARRNSGGAKPSFSIYELWFDIPDEVMAHPAIQGMMIAAVDLTVFGNDLLSYNMEQMRGDDLHNIVTCVMHERQTDVNGAMLWVENFLLGAADRFLAAKAALPQWEEPLNSQVNAYVDGLGQWVRALDDWSFESERYFGDKGLELKESRWMLLLPKRYTTEIGPVHIDSSLL